MSIYRHCHSLAAALISAVFLSRGEASCRGNQYVVLGRNRTGLWSSMPGHASLLQARKCAGLAVRHFQPRRSYRLGSPSVTALASQDVMRSSSIAHKIILKRRTSGSVGSFSAPGLRRGLPHCSLPRTSLNFGSGRPDPVLGQCTGSAFSASSPAYHHSWSAGTLKNRTGALPPHRRTCDASRSRAMIAADCRELSTQYPRGFGSRVIAAAVVVVLAAWGLLLGGTYLPQDLPHSLHLPLACLSLAMMSRFLRISWSPLMLFGGESAILPLDHSRKRKGNEDRAHPPTSVFVPFIPTPSIQASRTSHECLVHGAGKLLISSRVMGFVLAAFATTFDGVIAFYLFFCSLDELHHVL